MFPIPKSFFLTRGIGTHKERLTAFELALRDADIEQQNLVTVSSILPPGCVELERDAGVATLQPGEITFAVMARSDTDEPGRRVNSSIGLARPSDTSMYGYHLGVPWIWHGGASERRLCGGPRGDHAGVHVGN